MNHWGQINWSKSRNGATGTRRVSALTSLNPDSLRPSQKLLTPTDWSQPPETAGRWTAASPLRGVLRPVGVVHLASAPPQWWRWTVRWWGPGLAGAAASWRAAASWTTTATYCMINMSDRVNPSQTTGLPGAASADITCRTPRRSPRPGTR